MIDLALAGDNAVAVGLAAAGLPVAQRRKAIVLGLMGAVVMLIAFALMAVFLLKQIGLLLAGGVLLIWVCWKMWGELHAQHVDDIAQGEELWRTPPVLILAMITRPARPVPRPWVRP